MIDLHHHLLFGVDDGSPDIETSVSMVQMAAVDGITHIVATPHANGQFRYNRAAHEERLQQLRDALPADLAARMHLGLGCDFHIDFDNLERVASSPREFTINRTEYLLIELPDTTIPPRMDQILYDLRLKGLTPILTHPERNGALQRSLAPLRPWLRADLLVQVTAGSLLGRFGGNAEELAWLLVEQNWVTVIASDAHNLTRRPPAMREAYDAVACRLGQETAERLCVTNPLAIYQGKPLPEQPERVALGEPVDAVRPWWKRLLNR